MAVKLVVGLGNPGAQYARTPHNAGFMVVDEFAGKFSANWREEARFQGSSCRIRGRGMDLALLKPATFMNLSGASVGRYMHYYGMQPAELVVVSDDADLPVGRIRIRKSGSAGGHNGLKSVIAAVGTEAFTRVRVGIGRAAAGGNLADYVLGRMPADAEAVFAKAVSTAAEAVGCIVAEGADAAMNRFNSVVC